MNCILFNNELIETVNFRLCEFYLNKMKNEHMPLSNTEPAVPWQLQVRGLLKTTGDWLYFE